MNRYYHSGGCGDLIYGLQAIRQLGPGVLFTGLVEDRHDAMREFLLIQKNVMEVRYAPQYAMNDNKSDLAITHDLDKFRQSSGIGAKSLVLCHLEAFGLNTSRWREPWLIPPSLPDSDNFALINRTLRYNDPAFNWNAEIDYLYDTYGNVQFVGTIEEHKVFISKYKFVPYRITPTFMDLADLINSCKVLSCNQSSCLTIAQGLGAKYRLEVAPNHTNTIFYTPNETLLNR